VSWTTDSMVKVGPKDAPKPPSRLELRAARNEFESLQLHVHAQGGALAALDVRVSDLVDDKSGARILAGSQAVVSLEGYTVIERPSNPTAPRGPLPDVLFPRRDPLMNEARNAFPFDVPPEETRSVWIDLFVPPETPPGDYRGQVELLQDGAVRATHPFSFHVWRFTLPSTASLQSFFAATSLGACTQFYGGYEGCGKLPGAERNPDRGVERTHVAMARMLLDHRISSAEVAYAGSQREGWRHFDQVYEPLLFGTAPTRLAKARLTTLAYVGPADDMAFVRAWYEHAKEKGWDNRLVYYQCDEPPRTCSFERVKDRGLAVHGVSPAIPVLVTTDMKHVQDHGLGDAVDIVTPNVAWLHPRDETMHRGDYSAFLERPRKRLWWYQACSQHGACEPSEPETAVVPWPSYTIDASPMQNRVFQWLAFVYGVSGELYYQVDHCWSHPCGVDGKVRDPFRSVYAYRGNGDGTLVYPGLPSRIGGTSPTILSSVRLEHIRDGFEDYEYLAMLQAHGLRPFADEVTATFIDSAWHFSADPSRLQEARRRIGERLDGLP